MMKPAVAFVLLCSLLAISSTAEEFDFFYLVQQWPGSFCDTWSGCCFPDTGKPAADFGIHGLWPNYAKCHSLHDDEGLAAGEHVGDVNAFFHSTSVGRRHGKNNKKKCWPEYCDDGNAALSPWEIRDLVASMETSWPTLSCKSSQSIEFWSYEWKKHGTCSNLGKHDYFARALALKAAYNLTAILAAAGIVPSATDTYSLSDVSNAIAKGTGFTANLECNRDADGEDQLFQVYQCVDRDGAQLIDCPVPMPTKCHGDQVKLPLF